MFSCIHLINQIDAPRVMPKKQMQEKQQGGEDERAVAKSRPARNLVSMTPNRSSTVSSSSSSLRPGSLRAHCSTLDSSSKAKPPAMDSNKDKASGSQVCHADTNPNSCTGILVARSKKSTIGHSSIPHNLAISPHSVGFLDKVVASVRQKLGRPKEDKMERVDTKAVIWRILMAASTRAALHLGKEFEKIRVARNRILRDSARVLHHTEIGP